MKALEITKEKIKTREEYIKFLVKKFISLDSATRKKLIRLAENLENPLA